MTKANAFLSAQNTFALGTPVTFAILITLTQQLRTATARSRKPIISILSRKDRRFHLSKLQREVPLIC